MLVVLCLFLCLCQRLCSTLQWISVFRLLFYLLLMLMSLVRTRLECIELIISKNRRFCIHGNYMTLLLISDVYKILCYVFADH